jgi:FlaG/FlaF family flagellin (archaellin)
MKQFAWGVMGVVLSLMALGSGTVSAAPTTEAATVVGEEMAPEMEQTMRSRQATGTIVSVDAESKTVTVKAREGERTFSLSPRVRIKLGNLKATLSDVQPGQRVFIRYRDLDGQATATTIKVL